MLRIILSHFVRILFDRPFSLKIYVRACTIKNKYITALYSIDEKKREKSKCSQFLEISV